MLDGKPISVSSAFFGCEFARKIARGVVRHLIRTGFRIPLLVIHAVENSAEFSGVFAQQIVHTEPVLGSLNLTRIGWAHRVDGVGPDDAGFEIAHKIPEFQAAGIV